jgi:hypothetical protein
MYYLTKKIKGKLIYLKTFNKGEIETTENKAEAMQFDSKDAANLYAKQSISTLTWRATADEK